MDIDFSNSAGSLIYPVCRFCFTQESKRAERATRLPRFQPPSGARFEARALPLHQATFRMSRSRTSSSSIIWASLSRVTGSVGSRASLRVCSNFRSSRRRSIRVIDGSCQLDSSWTAVLGLECDGMRRNRHRAFHLLFEYDLRANAFRANEHQPHCGRMKV